MNEKLEVAAVEDYSVNGLQVQGTQTVRKIALATDAALSVYQKAAQAKCDMVIAHHGLVWGGIKAVTGRYYEHIKFLIDHEINLYAAHLPLDANPTLGNNAQLALMLQLDNLKPFGAYHGTRLGYAGTLSTPVTAEALAQTMQREIGGEPLILPFGPKTIQSVGIVSGGGSSTLPEAIENGLDCFITGEGKHEDHHLALEGRINVLYLGHYQSETVGVKALGRDLENQFDVETVFIDEPTIL